MPLLPVFFLATAIAAFRIARRKRGWKQALRAFIAGLGLAALLAVVTFVIFTAYFAHLGDAGALMHASFIAGPLLFLAPVGPAIGLAVARIYSLFSLPK